MSVVLTDLFFSGFFFLLTVHFDMEGNGRISQVTLGVEGILSLLLCIHSLQMQTCVVSKKEGENKLQADKAGHVEVSLSKILNP